MGYNYWKMKAQNAVKASEHTREMQETFSNRIKQSVAHTEIFNEVHVPLKDLDLYIPEIIVEDLDSVSAIFKYCTGNIAVLNFASYKYPGGQFIYGSSAQEEALCHKSFLYNVLREFEVEYYDWNRRNKNKALYLNRALYTPEVLFIDSVQACFCDVITCAAPNKKAAQKYCSVSDEENTEYLTSRIDFVLNIAAIKKVDTLILGAYGCGVFEQDPTEVAAIFAERLQSKKCFKRVIFAIPNKHNSNYEVFKKILT